VTIDAGRMRVGLITGTTREGRFSQRVATWVIEHLRAREDFEAELVDLRDHPLPFFDAPPPARTPREYPRDDIARLGRIIDRSDGFIILTAEYNHGYPAVLKNAMDWTFVEWRRKPVTFVGWGNVGGARAIEQLRQVAVEFEMAPLRHAVHILPEVLIRAREAIDPADTSAFAPLEPRLQLLLDDLAWWTATLRTDAPDRRPS
jgi:NAD(P)H-dependent FMN reductase